MIAPPMPSPLIQQRPGIDGEPAALTTRQRPVSGIRPRHACTKAMTIGDQISSGQHHPHRPRPRWSSSPTQRELLSKCRAGRIHREGILDELLVQALHRFPGDHHPGFDLADLNHRGHHIHARLEAGAG